MGSLLDMKDHLLHLLRQVGVHLSEDKFVIIDRGKPHIVPFSETKLYVYTFKYDTEYLKIGKAGKKVKHDYRVTTTILQVVKVIWHNLFFKIRAWHNIILQVKMLGHG